MKACSKFKIFFDFDGFGAIGSDDQWYSNSTERKCITCRRGYKRDKKECVGSAKELPRSAYGSDDQWYSNSAERKCI